MKKGQVSTEYLVILAVVLVVALVVVYLVGGFAGLGAGSLETQSKNYWASASPFSIETYKVEGTTVSMELTNMDLEEISLTAISFDGTDLTGFTSTTFGSGETIAVNGTLGTTCGSEGDTFTYDVVFTYTKGDVTGIDQTGAKALVGKCS